MRRLPIILFVGVLLLADTYTCFAQWSTTIQCPSDRVYRDERKAAGREEFCEHLLSGSLKVKDGPYRSWFSEGHPGEKGNYSEGRKVGPWTECNRFDRCKQVTHEASDAVERGRIAFRPEIPLSYSYGKYSFDFASCRSTWITQAQDQSVVELNIYGMAAYRCQITYTPQHAMENGVQGEYLCRIPFGLGRREFSSLDLMSELPKMGLPQFCKPTSLTGEAFLALKNGSDVASTVDVLCANIERDSAGRDYLKIRLNEYAADLVRTIADQKAPLKTLICLAEVDEVELSASGGGKTLFTYRLSRNPAMAKKQRACIAKAIGLKSACH